MAERPAAGKWVIRRYLKTCTVQLAGARGGLWPLLLRHRQRVGRERVLGLPQHEERRGGDVASRRDAFKFSVDVRDAAAPDEEVLLVASIPGLNSEGE